MQLWKNEWRVFSFSLLLKMYEFFVLFYSDAKGVVLRRVVSYMIPGVGEYLLRGPVMC